MALNQYCVSPILHTTHAEGESGAEAWVPPRYRSKYSRTNYEAIVEAQEALEGTQHEGLIEVDVLRR